MKLAIKPSRPLLLAVLMLASVVTALLGADAAGKLRGMVHWAFAPFGDAGMYLTTRIKQGTAGVESFSPAQARRLKQMNQELQRRINTLETEVMDGKQTVRNGKVIFSRLFGPSSDTPVRLIPARVVAADSLPYSWTRLLNAGEKHGAETSMYVTQRRLLTDRSKKLPKNLAVLSGTVLVGRLIETGAHTARMRMVTDAGFEIPAQVRRVLNRKKPRIVQDGDRRVRLNREINTPIEVRAYGDGAKGLVVPEVRKVHNIRPGDVLQTRPDNGSLPVAVDIGTVTEVSDDPRHAGMVKLHIKPGADLPALYKVWIVVPRMARLGSEHRR